MGLTHCEQQNVLCAAFTRPHVIRRRIQILDLDHRLVADVSDKFLEGQVNVDEGSEISRSATVSLFDPRHEIGFDSDNPASGIVSPKYLLRLWRGIYVDEWSAWKDIPVGTLWLTKPARTGDILALEAQGKEALALKPATKQLLLPAGMLKTTAITTIMHSIGETRFRIEPSTARLGKDFVVAIDSSPWKACKKIAKGMNRQLFYDAEGYVVLRTRPTAAVYTFRYGDRGAIVSDPQFTFTEGEFYNEVWATGGTPKGQNAPIIKKARVDENDPLYIKRDGIFIPSRFDVSDDKLVTPEDVQALADETLAKVVLDSQSATFDSLPIWHLEEGDTVLLTDALDDNGTGASYAKNVRLRSFSIPLGIGTQSNGYMRRAARSRSTLRRVA
jgi:hypothetical protein